MLFGIFVKPFRIVDEVATWSRQTKLLDGVLEDVDVLGLVD